MKKNKTIRMVLNGTILAAIAVIGVTAYQLGTAPLTENTIPQEEYAENTGEGLEDWEIDELPDHLLADADNEATEQEYSDEFAGEGEALQTGTDETDEFENLTEDTNTGEEVSEEELDDTESAASGSVTAENEDSSLTEDIYTVEEDWNGQENISEEAAAIMELSFSEDSEMIWPVNGTIIQDYNMEQTVYFPTLDQYKLSPAIAIQAVEGAPVLAAAEGVVSSVENDARTGTTVKMELGDGYQATYGQLRDLTVEDGKTVQAGEIIGYIHTPTKYYTLEGSNLYFAMEKSGKPLDPLAYLP